jgi:putative transposase
MQLTRYDTRLTDAAWELVAPLLPATRARLTVAHNRYARGCQCNLLCLLRTGCQWRLLPREFPAWGTVYYYFRNWENLGVWTNLQINIAGALQRAYTLRLMRQ